MTVNPQPSGTPDPDDLDRVNEYRRVVLEYEALDEEIDELLARHHGATERMSDEDFEHYRELARRRDDIYNQMKALERQILDEEPDDAP